MKLNNKGMTLVELLVSVVLVGVVLVFLFQLLVDLKNESENNDFAYNNQINRTEAIYTIQKDLQKYTLVGVNNVSSTGIEINFYYKEDLENPAVLKISESDEKYYLYYSSVSDEEYSWEMKGASVDPCGTFDIYKDDNLNNYYFKLNIFIYNSVLHEQNSEQKNNPVDDIELTYAGDKNYLETNPSYGLTQKTGTYDIGKCSE